MSIPKYRFTTIRMGVDHNLVLGNSQSMTKKTMILPPQIIGATISLIETPNSIWTCFTAMFAISQEVIPEQIIANTEVAFVNLRPFNGSLFLTQNRHYE